MPKTIYRSVTSKRRTSRPKAAKRAGAGFDRMLHRLSAASASLAAARRGR